MKASIIGLFLILIYGSWGKEREIDIIRSGGIHHKKTDFQEVSIN